MPPATYSETYSNQIWTQWVITTQTGSSTQTNYITDNIWSYWVDQTGTTLYVNGVIQQNTGWQPPTAEELAERRQREEETQRRRQAARARARSLLYNVLTVEQVQVLEKHGHIPVVGSKGRRYCVRNTGQSGNVDLLDADGKVMGSFCAHPGEILPLEDAWLAQVLHLTTDEDDFLRRANLHRGRRPELVAA